MFSVFLSLKKNYKNKNKNKNKQTNKKPPKNENQATTSSMDTSQKALQTWRMVPCMAV